jgi:hypothetical protein
MDLHSMAYIFNIEGGRGREEIGLDHYEHTNTLFL